MNITPPNFSSHILPTDRRVVPCSAIPQNNTEINSLIDLCLDQSKEVLELLPSGGKKG